MIGPINTIERVVLLNNHQPAVQTPKEMDKPVKRRWSAAWNVFIEREGIRTLDDTPFRPNRPEVSTVSIWSQWQMTKRFRGISIMTTTAEQKTGQCEASRALMVMRDPDTVVTKNSQF